MCRCRRANRPSRKRVRICINPTPGLLPTDRIMLSSRTKPVFGETAMRGMQSPAHTLCRCVFVAMFVELLSTELFAEQLVAPPLIPEQCETRMQWWRDAKFGLFIHWGPASVSGKEISWARVGHPHDGIGHESLPAEVYDNLYKQFNPVKFDANQWMRMAKNAGMRYVVFVAKHHDGFSMWPTTLRPDYSIAATPFKRDICKETADAAHKHGLKLGWYYSTRDWTHPDYLNDGNTKYNEFYHGQIRELLSNYGRVDILWFDHVAGNWGDYHFPELFDMIHRLQPEILINNRGAAFFQPTKDLPTPEIAKLVRGDFDTPEQQIGKFQTDLPGIGVTLTECADGGGWCIGLMGDIRGFAEVRTDAGEFARQATAICC